MAYDELNDTYTCANERTLKPVEVRSQQSQTGYRKKSPFMNVKPTKLDPYVQHVPKKKKEEINELKSPKK